MEGTVGPNTVDIMECLIEQNTDFGTDAASFNAVRSRLANYPSHFALTDRKQILHALEEVAFQARCAIVLKDNTFYLRYLPAEPTPVETITESDNKVILRHNVRKYGTKEREFGFKYDTETEQFGAGTAFLQEEDE